MPDLGLAYQAFNHIPQQYLCDAVVSGAVIAAQIYGDGCYWENVGEQRQAIPDSAGWHGDEISLVVQSS